MRQSFYHLLYFMLPSSACIVLEVTSVLFWISLYVLSSTQASVEYWKRVPTVLSIPFNREHPESGVYFCNVACLSPLRTNLKTEAAGTLETSGYTAPTSRKTGNPNSHRRVNLRLQTLKNCPLWRHRRQTQRIDVLPSGLLNCCAALGKSNNSQVCYSARNPDNILARVQLEHRLLAYALGVLTSRDEYQLAAKNWAPLGCYTASSGVVPKPSGKLGRAYCGRCEAYPGIPTGTGNER